MAQRKSRAPSRSSPFSPAIMQFVWECDNLLDTFVEQREWMDEHPEADHIFDMPEKQIDRALIARDLMRIAMRDVKTLS